MAWSFLISLPGVGNLVLATLLAEASDASAMTMPCAVWGRRASPGSPAETNYWQLKNTLAKR